MIRRASAVEDLGVGAAIGRGLRMTRGNLKEFGAIWLTWIGMRLVWMVAWIPVLIVLTPLLVPSLIAAASVGAVPATVLGAVLTPFLQGPFPWIIGGVVALPIFFVILFSPMLFVSGLVEIMKSNTWTFAYHEVRAQEEQETVPSPDLAGVEAAATA